jgi:hypothetical protein
VRVCVCVRVRACVCARVAEVEAEAVSGGRWCCVAVGGGWLPWSIVCDGETARV